MDLYIDYVFNKSVRNPFMGFYDGFMKVCGGPILELFRAHELRSVVTGNEDYDWETFENSAIYKNGYTSSDPTVSKFYQFISFHLHQLLVLLLLLR